MSRHRIHISENNVFTYEISGRRTSPNDSSQKTFTDWKDHIVKVMNWEVIPFGQDNDMPLEIQEPIFASNQGKRIQSRKAELLWGVGPELYTVDTSEKIPARNYQQDTSIQQWLDNIDYTSLLQSLIEDYYYTEVLFQKVYRNKGHRIGKASEIALIEHLGVENCRLCYRASNKFKLPTHVMVADWSQSHIKDFDIYPIFNPSDPYRYPVSISYLRKRSFATPHYAIPDVFGALPWIRRSNAIPFVLEALTNNTLNIKWHIISPQSYWEEKQKALMAEAKKENREYDPQELEVLKKDILDKIGELLSGVDNVGKFWHNEKVISALGATPIEHSWEIKPIEQKVKDFISSQLEIAKHADFASASAMGLHTSLANIGADGKSDSGSEQLYALDGHQKTSTKVPEYYVTKLLNQVIKLKFNTDLKVGFRHELMNRLEDKSSSQRQVNQLAE